MTSNNPRSPSADSLLVVVPAANGNSESRWVGLTISAILLLAAAALYVSTPAREGQHSITGDVAPSQLSNGQKALLTELNTAAQEIKMWHQEEGQWPSAVSLASQWIAPFTQDASWQSRGAHQWQQIIFAEEVWYWSMPALLTKPESTALSVSNMLLQVPKEGRWQVWFAAQVLAPEQSNHTLQTAMEQALINAALSTDASAHLKAAGWLRVMNEDHRVH